MLSNDQADQLRRLVRQCAHGNDPVRSQSALEPNAPARSPSALQPPALVRSQSAHQPNDPAPGRSECQRSAPPLVLIAGGKGGVGTTTLASNLAVVLAGRGLRVALIDADLRGGDLAAICGVEPRWTIDDVLARRKRLADALVPAPQGIHILPDLWEAEQERERSPADGDRLRGQLGDLAGMFDAVMVDAGNGLDSWLGSWWPEAAAVLMVATPETRAVLGAYAGLKLRIQQRLLHDCWLVVNFAPNFQAAREVEFRITRAAARFLGFRPRWLGHVPAEPAVAEATRAGRLFVEAAPGCAAAGCLRRIAAELAAEVAAAARIAAARAPAAAG